MLEDSYTTEDVESMLDGLCAVVKSNIQTELQNTSHCNVVLIRQLFRQAEKLGVELAADTATLENEFLLKQVAKWEDASKQPAAPLSGSGGMAVPKSLPSLGDQMATMDKESQKITAQLNEQSDENTMLRDRLQKMQIQCTSILKEKSQLAAELEQSRATVSQLESQTSGTPAATPAAAAAPAPATAAAADGNDASLQEQLRVRSLELEQARRDMTEKLNNSKQFVQMKKMVTDKNKKMKELRDLLRKYAPADVVGDIDAAEDA